MMTVLRNIPCRYTYVKYVMHTMITWALAIVILYIIMHLPYLPMFRRGMKQTRQACIHPRLLLNDSTMMRNFRKYRPTVCKGEEDWIFIHNGSILYKPAAIKKYYNFTCTYVPLLRRDDYSFGWGKKCNITNGFQITHDFFKIHCVSAQGKLYEGLHAGVAFTHERVTKNTPVLDEGFGGLSIAILGFDSMSRMSWLRRLPLTRQYFHKELGAIELEGHNIVGDGTTSVLFPMLTGKFEWELPEARLHYPNASKMDNFNFIWREFNVAGYLTSWSNANPNTAPFNYRFLRFEHQPTDFYMRPFYQAFEKAVPKNKRECLGSLSFSRIWLNYFRDIFLMYRHHRKFVFHFLVEMSHDNNNLITKVNVNER